MSTLDLIQYYANLLILQWIGNPKAYNTIQALVTPVIMDQLPVQVQNAYNLTGPNPAVGVQLDVLGKYQGVSRTGNTLNGPITLNDAEFLTLIRFAISRNYSQSSLSAIAGLMNFFFPGEVLVFDYANMHMSYLISTTVGDQNLIEVLLSEGLLPKPMGVSLSVILAPVINKFFGFKTYDAPSTKNTPFTTYDLGFDTTSIWLTYDYGITL